MSEPTVCVKALRPPFFAATLKTGLAIPDLAARFNLPPARLTDLTARVPHSTVVRAWDDLALLCQDPVLGLSAASVLGPTQLDLVDIVFHRASTVRAMTSSLVRYQRLFHDANDVRLSDEGSEVVARHTFTGDLPRSRHFIEFILAMWVGRLRAVAGAERAARLRVSFRHPAAAPLSRYHALFGERVDFEASMDGMAITSDVVDEPLPAADPAMTRALEAHLDRELEKLSSTSFPERVMGQIIALIRAGSSDAFAIERVARRLNVSRRTLQRRLAEEKTTFRDLVDAARRSVTLEELGRGASTLTDLAFLLGFSEHSAFSRAFRRWTGTSPAHYLKEASARGAGYERRLTSR